MKLRGRAAFCGPTTIAFVGRMTTTEAEQHIRRANPELAGKNLRGLMPEVLEAGMREAGLTIDECLYYAGRRLRDLPRDETFAVFVSHHFLAVHKGKVYDTNNPRGVTLGKHPNQRIKQVWRVAQ